MSSQVVNGDSFFNHKVTPDTFTTDDFKQYVFDITEEPREALGIVIPSADGDGTMYRKSWTAWPAIELDVDNNGRPLIPNELVIEGENADALDHQIRVVRAFVSHNYRASISFASSSLG